MYLPAFPQMELALGASTDAVQRTLAAFFLGFALGQASYGPVTDRFGRKPPLYFGLGLYVLASIGCALAPSAEVLTVLRFVQAVGACSGMVIARAMVRDLFDPKDAARAYSSLMLVTGLAPILAPVIGGIVLVWSVWPTIFWILAAYALLALAAVHWRLPETHPADPRGRSPSAARSPTTGASCAMRATWAMPPAAASAWPACSPTSPARRSSSSTSTAFRPSSTAGSSA